MRNIVSKNQSFLKGHSNSITSIAISKDGSRVASGESSLIGFISELIVWNFESRRAVYRLRIHKGGVASVAFSPSGKFLASVGARDDRQLVVWDVTNGVPITSIEAHPDTVHACSFFKRDDSRLITCGANHVKIWHLNEKSKLDCDKVSMGSLKRTYTTIAVAEQSCYCGTQSGDIVEVDLGNKLQKRCGPLKTPFELGVSCLTLIPNGDLLVGTGTGSLAKVALSSLKIVTENKQPDHRASISSIALTPDGTHFFAGSTNGSIMFVNTETLLSEIRSTSLVSRVNAISFPHGLSDIFATASGCEIRLWNSKTKSEMLSIRVPNIECLCIDFALDGKSIISGWSDGKIRAFTPQSGTLLFAIPDAHKDGVTVIKMLSDCVRVVSGGMKGDVRMWKLSKSHQELIVSLKEHRGRISGLVIRTDDNARAVTTSADGSCIVWDLEKNVRLICIFESTVFRGLAYHPDFSQIVTIGSDNRLTYYDVFDGQSLRVLELKASVVTTSKSGSDLIIGSQDGKVSLIDYDRGEIVHTCSHGHSGDISALAIAPNQSFIVSGGVDGGLFFWTLNSQTADRFA